MSPMPGAPCDSSRPVLPTPILWAMSLTCRKGGRGGRGGERRRGWVTRQRRRHRSQGAAESAAGDGAGVWRRQVGSEVWCRGCQWGPTHLVADAHDCWLVAELRRRGLEGCGVWELHQWRAGEQARRLADGGQRPPQTLGDGHQVQWSFLPSATNCSWTNHTGGRGLPLCTTSSSCPLKPCPSVQATQSHQQGQQCRRQGSVHPPLRNEGMVRECGFSGLCS